MNTTIRLFAFFFLLVWLLFRNTEGAGFVTDHIGWLHQYETQGPAGLLHAFGDKSFHFVYHLAGFLLWKAAGFRGEVWMLIFAALHAAVASVAALVFSQFLQNEGIQRARTIAFFGSFLFLVSPYATEVLVWYACIHYLLCSLLLLGAFYFVQQYAQRQRTKDAFSFYLLFLTATFTLEISFSFPLLVASYLLWAKNIHQRMRLTLQLALPAVAIVVFYLGVNQYWQGSAIGHYGAATHLNFSIPLLAGNLCKYSAKLFAYTQFLSYDNRQSIYLFLEKQEVTYGVFFVLMLVAFMWLTRFKKWTAPVRSSALLFFFFVCALLPVLNLYFSYIVPIEGDRLSYFASLFASQLVALLCFSAFRSWGYLPLIFLLLFQKPLLDKNITAWEESGRVHRGLLDSYRWQNAAQVFVLQLPDNFRGAYLYRDDVQGNVFNTELRLRHMISPSQKVTQIIAYNMQERNDSIRVEPISDNEVKITFAQYGNWWWQKGVGASSFTTEAYEVRIGEWNECFIKFPHHYPGAVFIYQNGTAWRELKNFNNAQVPAVGYTCG